MSRSVRLGQAAVGLTHAQWQCEPKKSLFLLPSDDSTCRVRVFMPGSLFPWRKYRAYKKPSGSQDDIPLSQLGTRPPLQDQVVGGGGQLQVRNYWRSLCYSLHAFLIAIHLTLLTIAASNHAERQVAIQYDIDAFTTGLSGGLQAFYTLYTALLVFVTQRLMLSSIFSSPKKLTQIHDICGAWAGLGAALSALWQQTKVASSILSVALVMVYFVCISVLHVTSSTLIQLQLLNETITSTGAVFETWPDASIDLASLDWMAVTTLVPFLSDLYGNATDGLANSTLYDFPLLDYISATVNATTVNAQCGLLTNLSVEAVNDSTWNVSAAMSTLGPLSIIVPYPPLLNEIWFSPSIQCSQPICSTFILYLVSTELEVDDSSGDVNHVYINGSYYPPGGTAQNFSTPIYFVACSLNSTTRTVALDASGIQLDAAVQPTDVAWSAFSPAGDLNLTSGISAAMTAANSLPLSPYCQPIMSYQSLWANITAFNAYMSSVLGMSISSCSGASLAQYTSTPLLLMKYQVESVVSRTAAEFLWLAGELGSAGGGFDRIMGETSFLPLIPEWKLNINLLPVIIALCASVILLVLVVCALWKHDQVAVSSTGVLEMMWFGSRSQVLRSHLSDVQTPSLDSLRASSMFETVFWTRPSNKDKEDNSLYAPVPRHNVESRASSSKSLGLSGSGTFIARHELDVISRRVGKETEALRPSNASQAKVPQISNNSRSRRWCYALHIVLLALHVVLLMLLVHHPEHSVVVLSETGALTVGLSAFLQGFYTLYSTVLVLLMQRLALFKIVGERQKLTTVHDVSGAWTGVGAAIYVLWRQRKASSSTWAVASVGAYLALMLVLHITSSSIMQWQAVDDTLIGGVQTYLALPDSAVNISQLSWTEIFPIARSIGQDTTLTTHGLWNTTLYDVLQNPNDVAYSFAVVNATTFTAQCGLVPNLTSSYQNSNGEYQINFQNGTDSGSFLESPIWKDVVHAIVPSTQCVACPQTLFYMITTGINLNESVDESVVVGLNWTYMPSGGNTQTSTTATYIAACSVSAQTVQAILDIQLDVLETVPDQTTLGPASLSWSVWSPGNATDLSVGIATALWDDTTSLTQMFQQGNFSAEFSDMDSYIMSLLGLDLSSANTASESQSSADPSVTLSPWQLENAIAETAAKFLWLAGQLGENWGGFQRSVGDIVATNDIVQFRLHLNTTPIILASIASLLSFILAMFIIGKGPSGERVTSVTGTSVLECLWLEAHSESLHGHMETVKEPHLDGLRAAGMFDICLGDIGRSSYPEAEQPILESTNG